MLVNNVTSPNFQNFLKVSWSISKIDLIEVHATKANSSTYYYEFLKEVSVDVAMTSSWNGNDGSRVKSSWALYFIIISFWEACCCMLCHTIIIIMMIAMWELEYFFRKSHFCNELPLSTQLPRLSSNVGSHYLVLHRMWSNINQDKPWQKLSN